MIYIVIPVFNRWSYTKECLASLVSQTYKGYVIVVVDHGSKDETAANISTQFPQVVVLNGDESMWWTSATNLGVRYALENNADYVLTLNNDLVVGEHYLEALMKASESHSKTIIGSLSLDINNPENIVFAGTLWNSWNSKYRDAVPILGKYAEFKRLYLNIKSDLLPGRGTLIPSDIFKKVGLFDDVHFPHYMADEDLSLRAVKSGYSLVINTDCAVYSHIEATGLKSSERRKVIPYLKDTFLSVKSPSKLSVRWQWALKHGKIPVLYFVIDFGRVFLSSLVKSVRN